MEAGDWEQGWGFDPARRRLARQRSLVQYRWAAAGPVIGLLPMAWIVVSGTDGQVHALLAARAPSEPVTAAALAAVLVSGWWAWSTVWAFFSSYVPGRRYGLITAPPGAWIRDRAVGLALALVISAPAASWLGLLLADHPGGWWWRWWLVLAPGILLFSYVFPVLILPLFHRLTGMEPGPLRERLLALAARTGAPVADVHVIDLSRRTSAANAFVTGLGRTRRLILGDTLVDGFTPAEVEAVLAHELAHHRFWHVPLGILREVVGWAAVLAVSALVLPGAAGALGRDWPGGPGLLPLLVLIWAVMWTALGPLEAAISRRQERRCDARALDWTDEPEWLAAALVRLSDLGLSAVDPPRWVELLLMTHPPVRDRLELARGAGARPGRVRAVLGRPVPGAAGACESR